MQTSGGIVGFGKAELFVATRCSRAFGGAEARRDEMRRIPCRLAAEFPEVAAQIREDEAGLLHCEGPERSEGRWTLAASGRLNCIRLRRNLGGYGIVAVGHDPCERLLA